ncbi:MAG: hypothetical protein HN559_01410, partial [Gemmatimonadetes bacterium]|nr:hypothetical protein [Gemmatimonadota bacterium]
MHRSVRALILCSALPAALSAQMQFSDQALAAGVADEGEANGAAFGDFSGDGLPDLFVARLGRSARPLLYRNEGDGTFATADLNGVSSGSTMGGVFVDYDSDGDLDLYTISFFRPNQLFENVDGRLILADDALTDPGASTGAAFADYDRDGRVDLFTTHRGANANQYWSRPDQAGFVELSDFHSTLGSGRDSFGGLPFDYDSDGDVDIYVSNWGFANLLFSNQGRGSFLQVAREAGLSDEGWSILSLPADYDNDGDLDLYTLRSQGQASSLYMNEVGRFVDVEAGVGGTVSATGGAWADFDSDGDVDLLVSTAGTTALYENQRDGTFADVGSASLPAAALAAGLTGGVATADYDADGDIDAFIGHLEAADLLLRNDASASGRWLQVELVGRPGQTVLGSRVRVHSDDSVQLREYVVSTQIGTASGHELHFGLGDNEQVELDIHWASGQQQTLPSIAANQRLRLREPVPGRDLRIDTVTEPSHAPGWRPLAFEVMVSNVGVAPVGGTGLTARVEVHDRVQYEQRLEVPTLAPGESVPLRFPVWSPAMAGEHRFTFALDVDDDVAANNHWVRAHSLHDFDDVASQRGVADTGPGFAAAWADYDRDGDLDLYVSNGATAGDAANVLYRNDGDTGFTDVALASGVADDGNGTAAVFADFNSDGWEDLFISKGGFNTQGQANRLFHNNHDGTFADVSAAAGLDVVLSSYSAAAGDYDQDGYTDLYVSQFRGQPNQLYRNDGNGGFEEVGIGSGIVSFFNYGGSAASFADYDADGDVDLYASIFGTFDRFYADVGAAQFGVSEVGNEGDAVGITSGDYDNDGDLDVYVINQSRRSTLSRNDLETSAFVDVGEESGTENLALGAGCAFGDFDADGDLDLFVVNGGSADRVFMNRGDGSFVDMAAAFGMADTSWAWAVTLADYDNDGDLDVYVVNERSANRLYDNRSNHNNWLQVGLRGVESNTEALSARLQLYAGERAWTRVVNATSGMSHSSRVVHFGLGQTTRLDSLLVQWPRGLTERFVDVPVNSRLAVVEGQVLTAVQETTGDVPGAFALASNFPNPFNAETSIHYKVGVAGMVRLEVFNTLGQKIRGLVEGESGPGS